MKSPYKLKYPTMRTLIFFISLLLLPMFSFGQYYVIKVEPEGMVLANKQILKRRDKIADDTKLIFSSEEAFAHVLSPTNGHFILSGKKGRKNKKGEFIIALKEALIPSKEFKAAATRSKSLLEFSSFEHEFDFKKYFQGQMVFLDTVSFRVSTEKYLLDQNNGFYIQHNLKKDSFITYHLAQEKDFFSIFPDVLLDKDGKNIAEDIQGSSLLYKSETSEEYKMLARFSIRFLDLEEITSINKELICLREQFPGISESAFIEEQVAPYLAYYYGKFSITDIQKVLNMAQPENPK